MSGCGGLRRGDPAALYDHRLFRQEAPRAQDREQEAAQTQVRLHSTPVTVTNLAHI